MGPSLRWSAGIYCTRWDTEAPAGQRVLSIFHDSMRITTTLNEADPATWGGGDSPTPDAGADGRDATPDTGGDAGADSAPVNPGTGGSVGTGGATGAGGSSGTGGRSGTGGSPGTGGSKPEPMPEPEPARSPRTTGGCRFGGHGASSSAALLLAILGLRARRRR
jgi:hypothetical protein